MSIQPTRIRGLNDAQPRPGARFVLYWMQQSQRPRFNPALEFACEEALARGLPVLVCFGLTDDHPEANARHYAFMLEELAEVARLWPSGASPLQSAAGRPMRSRLGSLESCLDRL